MSTKLKPIKDRLIVKFESAENKTAGGIYLPDTADKEKPQIGNVIAIGTNKELVEAIKAGDKVIFGKYAGTEVDFDNQKYLILKLDDILAVINE